jgi:nuclear GTP-binding protein
MGTGKKEASRRTREGKDGKQKDGNIRVKGENFYRSASKFAGGAKDGPCH